MMQEKTHNKEYTMTVYNTRFAPSPTGDMHLGNLRTAYFNWLAARSTGGTFTVRIDDTDRDRNTDTAVDTILDILDWCGLDYDRLVRQSDRGDLYRSHIYDLNALGYIDDSDGADRINVDRWVGDAFSDMVNGDCRVTDRRPLTNLVVARSDGSPTYHFANVVDDLDLDINLVIRGSDHLSNTPRHIGLASALGGNYPATAHIGLIHYNKKKMSKRDDVGSVMTLRDRGIDPNALLSYLLRLGWAPRDDSSKAAWIWPKDKAVGGFWTKGRLKAKASNFDDGQFNWVCRAWNNGNWKKYV